MENVHGSTWLEVFGVLAIIVVATTFVVSAQEPAQELYEQRDSARQEDLRNIMEEFMILRSKDELAFSTMVDIAASGRTMIGSAEICPDDYGAQCMDAELRERCVQPEFDVPVNPFGEYSKDQTGYYIDVRGRQFIVGACEPLSKDRLEITADLF